MQRPNSRHLFNPMRWSRIIVDNYVYFYKNIFFIEDMEENPKNISTIARFKSIYPITR